jgi:hypothetical protein
MWVQVFCKKVYTISMSSLEVGYSKLKLALKSDVVSSWSYKISELKCLVFSTCWTLILGLFVM